MPKILMYSDQFLPTFPYLELPLYNEIKSRGVEVQYVLHKGDVRTTDPILSKTFSGLNLKILNSPLDILSILSKGDLVVSRFLYKGLGEKVLSIVKNKKYNILSLDPGGVDLRFRPAIATHSTSKSESLRKAAIKKFPKHYKKVFVTGTMHYDAAATIAVDRDKFIESYGLDSSKKLAIVTPANPGEAWMDGLQDDYKKIVEIVSRNTDYELAIKAHPLDHTASMKAQPGIIHKNEHYNGKHSWEVIAPKAAVVKPEEGYQALKAADVILNIRSSLAMEIPLFKKPLVNINRHKYVTNWPFDPNVMMDIKMSDLDFVLRNKTYGVNPQGCEEYINKYAFSGDGKAYTRIADVAIKILNGKV